MESVMVAENIFHERYYAYGFLENEPGKNWFKNHKKTCFFVIKTCKILYESPQFKWSHNMQSQYACIVSLNLLRKNISKMIKQTLHSVRIFESWIFNWLSPEANCWIESKILLHIKEAYVSKTEQKIFQIQS